MLKRGYGDRPQLTWLFLGLARAAGVDADAVALSTRDSFFFAPGQMREEELAGNAVRVKIDGKELYLDPGTAFAPFGFLPWYETGVRGLCLDKDGGKWVVTPTPGAAESRIERRATC